MQSLVRKPSYQCGGWYRMSRRSSWSRFWNHKRSHHEWRALRRRHWTHKWNRCCSTFGPGADGGNDVRKSNPPVNIMVSALIRFKLELSLQTLMPAGKKVFSKAALKRIPSRWAFWRTNLMEIRSEVKICNWRLWTYFVESCTTRSDFVSWLSHWWRARSVQ